MEMGDRIKELRLVMGLTQEELGNIVGVKKAAVQKWESGAVKNLKKSIIEQLSKIFNVSIDYLIGTTSFRNKEEESYSIIVALVNYLLRNSDFISDGENYMFFMKKNSTYKLMQPILEYFTELLERSIRNQVLPNEVIGDQLLSDLEKFELANIWFKEIKWEKAFDGKIYCVGYNGNIFNFEINADNVIPVKLDLSKSRLFYYQNLDKSNLNIYSSLSNISPNIITENTSVSNNKEDIINLEFDKPEEIIKYILKQPALMDYGKYNLEGMTEADLSNLANDLLYALKLSIERRKQD